MTHTKNIVILHGWGSSVVKFEPLAANLKKTGWKVLTVEMPGFDLKAPQKPWTLNDYADFIVSKARKHFGKSKYVLFGHSFGARIGIKIASEGFPELSGLVLCSAPGISRTVSVKRYAFAIISKIGKLTLGKNPHPIFKKMLYKFAREHDYEKTSGVMKQTMTNVISEDLKPLVSKINIPTLILWGDKDTMTPPKDAKFINNKIPGSVLNIHDGYGHRIPYDIPEILSRDIEIWFKKL